MLADGQSLAIEASESGYERLVETLACPGRRYRFVPFGPGPRRIALPAPQAGVIPVRLGPVGSAEGRWVAMNWTSTLIGLEAEGRGGVLLHAALVACRGRAAALAGPGGIGKTTAAERLPAPWQMLCDDTILVLRCGQDGYRVHPWPTWSCFLYNGSGGSWPCTSHFPLGGVFFLDRSGSDAVEPIGPAAALGALLASAEQATAGIWGWLAPGAKIELRRQRLENLIALARTVPCYRLAFTRSGDFGTAMEKVL
jgi:SynChlorMet cassette protein ScmC